MANLVFEGEMARIQHGFAQCHDLMIRRSVGLGALNLRSGERVLEQGSGGGFYTYEIARCVGPQDRVAAIDISAVQIAAAQDHCREMSWVECRNANANDLPHGKASSMPCSAFKFSNTFDEEEIDAWLGEFPELDARGQFFFSTTTVLTEKVRTS